MGVEMSFFTQNDCQYVKDCLARIRTLAYQVGFHEGVGADAAKMRSECDGELARLVAFIDGCTLEGRHDRA